MKSIKIFLVLLISMVYIFSAYNKITNFNTVANGLKDKISSSVLFNWIPNLGFDISKLALLFAIFLLIAGPILMLYGVYNNANIISNSSSFKFGVLLLSVFLILATILYHPPNDPNQTYNFLKNLSLLGSLGFIVI
jgi:uncharacterized membrane protein YphA (DoxX/SURF4 family)